MRLFLMSVILTGLIAIAGCGREGVSAQKTDADRSAPLGDKPSGINSGSDDAATGAPGGKLAKRAGPPDVEPVTINDVEFVVIHWGKSRGFGQNGGYIAAYNAATGEELWTLKVYDVTYDPQKEQDVQDIFIESITKTDSGDRLLVTDETGRVYRIDPETRTVLPR